MFEDKNKSVDSYYEHTRNRSIDAPAARGDIKTDVVVIGGGLTGCSTALHLASHGVDVVVVEARQFGWGASGRSGGQISIGFSSDEEVLEKLVGMETAKELWDHSVKSVEYTRELVETHKIDCDLTMGFLHCGIKTRHARELSEWVERLARIYDYEALEFFGEKELRQYIGSELYAGGVGDPGSGHLHPLNYCLGVAAAAQKSGAKLFQNSTVEKIETSTDGKIVHCDSGKIHCEQVVYGCNAYLEKTRA